MDKSIMPECFADTLLIETLVPTKYGYNHKRSCFKVEEAMTKGAHCDSFALGIIDNDKRTIGYLNEFEKIDEVLDELILWKHQLKPHYIIQICPALEKWILNVCNKLNIDIEDNRFGLKNDLESLKKITKSMSSLNDQRLIRLFTCIKDKGNIESVRKLIGWITVLKQKNYNIDLNELKNV